MTSLVQAKFAHGSRQFANIFKYLATVLIFVIPNTRILMILNFVLVKQKVKVLLDI